jgi:hypothetical protein
MDVHIDELVVGDAFWGVDDPVAVALGTVLGGVLDVQGLAAVGQAVSGAVSGHRDGERHPEPAGRFDADHELEAGLDQDDYWSPGRG